MVTEIPSPSSSLNMLVPGGAFRNYLLLEQIGIGGQAVVWSALDAEQKRIYAIKFNKILDADETRAEELGIEFKFEKLVELHHPHILPVHEYGSEERVRFMITPYIPGGTLGTRIRTTRLSFEQVIEYGVEIASALDYLHSQGVIHRDLKASNILLDLSNHTYLADFGLARIMSTSTLAFHTGHGTPPYSPPEQILSKEITPRSDIFSFGILLFEMLTGQLPWNGQKQLGVEQLRSEQELPDPREYITGLPPLITDVLRRITSANPDLRPRSASEAMRMIHYVFNIPAQSVPSAAPHDESAARDRDAEALLAQGLTQWESTGGRVTLGLTKFALIDLQDKQKHTDTFNQFMLAQALTYGYKDDEWWSKVDQPRERLLVSSALLKNENEIIAGRVLRHLAGDPDLRASTRGLPERLTTSLLTIATNTNDASLRQEIFAGLRTLVRPASGWKDPSLAPNQIKRLGVLALEDSEFGDAAAELIGHLRIPSAVKVILRHSNEARKIDTLLLIQKVAGSLPAFVPGRIRIKLSLEWILQRLIQQPVNLLSAYMMALLGSTLGIGLQVYLTINLPNPFDNLRITTSLERGLITGTIFGLGLFLIRVITERFPTANAFLRVILGTLVGSISLNLAMFIFHILFVKTTPQGFLVTLGCILIALTFAIGGVLGSSWLKMALSSLSIFIAIAGTWLIHVNLTNSPLELTPLFKYDYAWPLSQVLLTAFNVSLLIGVLGNLIPLAIKDESL